MRDNEENININIKLMPMYQKNIFLIGFMGAGKSAVSVCLGKLLNMNIIEVDKMIENQLGISISDIFKKYGEEHFRKVESDFISSLQYADPAIISCGGGVVMRQVNVDSMKQSGIIILLAAQPETILKRISNSDDRPLLKDKMNLEHIKCLMGSRNAAYCEAANIIVDTDGKTIEEIGKEIATNLDF